MRPGLYCCALLAAAVAATAGAPAGAAASCSRVTAKAAVKQVKPHIRSLANTSMLVTPAMVDQVLCFDLTGDGRTDVAVTIASGGTAGDIGWVALARGGSGWKLVHAGSGYKLGLFRLGNDLADSQPIYRKNDPNCCPTGGFDHRRWHWNGARLLRVRVWHTKSYKP
jgi:hypothetical protein